MAERKLTVTTGAATSAILVAVLVVSIIGSVGTNGAAQPSIDGEAIQSAEDPESADEIYVKENGDAVLVYQSDDESDDSLQTMDLGVSISEGLAHVLIEDSVDDELEENASGSLSLMLDQDKFTGDGTFSMNQPENLQSLTLDVTAERTSETNTFDATFDATVANDGQTPAVQSFDTSGDVSLSADAFRTTGEFEAQTMMPVDMGYDVSVSDTGSGYTLDVTQRQPVSEYQKDQWDTREAAKRTLESQYGGVAESFGGTSTVTIDSYSFEESSGTSNTLEVSYTVEYSNVKDGVATALAGQLAQDPELDLTRQQADAIAQSVVDVELRTLDASVDVNQGTVTGNWDVEIGNYEQALRAGLDAAESQSDSEDVTEGVEQIRTMLDAQKAADLKQTLEWSGSMTATGDTIEVSAEASSESENWAAYVQELQDAGVNAGQNDVSMDLHAETDGEDLSADMSMSVEQEDLVNSMVDAVVQSASQDPTTDQETERILRQLKNSEFQTGKLDVNVDSESVTIEAGAKFDNMSALGQEINDAYGGHDVTQLAGDLSENGEGELHVHVDGLVESGASEDDVRSLAVADSETEIHTGGDYDRSFQTMDTERAKTYLGLNDDESGESEEEDESDSSLPGFGAAAAAVALVGAALLARRQH